METTENKGLDFKFDCKPDFGYITVQIPSGETLKVEAAAMATMDTNIEMKTKLPQKLSIFGKVNFVNEQEVD